MELNPKLVDSWHKTGGTALETSRGGFDLNKIVDAIQDRGFNQVFFNFFFIFSSLSLSCYYYYFIFQSFELSGGFCFFVIVGWYPFWI